MAPTRQFDVLVVDDDDNARYTLERRLRAIGHQQIRCVSDGELALQAIQEHTPDLLLLDIMMPGMSGLDVLAVLSRKGLLNEIAVLVISAGDDIDHAVEAIQLGAEDYLTKPVRPTLLTARINSVLEKKTLRDNANRQLKLIREIFGRFVPDDVVEDLLTHDGNLAPSHSQATILYTDIANFTSTVDKISAADAVAMLNEYFTALIEPVSDHGGTVNQFQGDAMLVTYNVPTSVDDHADRAVRTAHEIRDIGRRQKFNGISLKTRIGVNTGMVMAGNVGSGERMNYTVHGHAVNLAAKLEAMNKLFGTDVLVSASTVELMSRSAEEAGLIYLDCIAPEGSSSEIEIYRLKD